MPVTQLQFITEPSDTQVNQRILPPVRVALKDEAGETVTTATDSITIAIEDNPGGGVLSGTVTRNAVAGIATFSDLRISQPGVDYSLRASSNITGEFSPADFCTLWVSGDAPTLAEVDDGDKVGLEPHWIDRITGVRYFYENSEERRPTFRTDGPNGLPYLEFVGTQKLTFSTTASQVLSTTGYAFFIVVRPNQPGNAACSFLGSVLYDFAGANGYGEICLCLNAGNNKFTMNHWEGDEGDTITVHSPTSYEEGDWCILFGGFDGENIYISVNREPAASAAADNLPHAANVPSINFADNLNADIEEIVQFNTYPGDAVLNQFWEWLSTRTAIALV